MASRGTVFEFLTGFMSAGMTSFFYFHNRGLSVWKPCVLLVPVCFLLVSSHSQSTGKFGLLGILNWSEVVCDRGGVKSRMVVGGVVVSTVASQ